MYHLRRIWVVAGLLLAVVVSGTAFANTAGGTNAFHAAATPAEKMVDTVLRLSEKDNNLLEYLLKTPQYDPKVANDYSRYFTKRLCDDMAAMEKMAVEENCQGKYIDGEVCGTDYNPLTCSQDGSEAPYQYRTESSADGKAVVAYKWRGEKDAQARFDLVEEGGVWKIDSVRCR